MKASVLIVSLAFTMIAACHSSRTPAPAAGKEELFSRNWKLVELNGMAPDLTSKEPFLMLEKSTGRVTGNGGCNSFFGNYLGAVNGQISFSQIGSTKMACPGLHVETEFFRSLEQVSAYSLKGDSLILRNAMKTLARFVASAN